MNPATKARWPDLLSQDPAFTEKLDIYSVTYDSFLFKANPSFAEVLGDMEKQLDNIFFHKKYSKIVLIGHSLGGNFARAYLLHVKNAYGHRPLSAFRLLYALGTPVNGADLATYAKFLTPNPHLRVLEPFPVNDFLQMLKKNWNDALNKQYRSFCDKIDVYSAFEKVATPVGIIVTQGSASAGANFAKGFELDHGGLAKPASVKAEIYTWVAEGLEACVKGVGHCATHGEHPNCGSGGYGLNSNRGLQLWHEDLRRFPPGPSTPD